ncbi:hypothetical protein TNCV_289771 [Trichonephila clavipes]|nr:hypothetical protein TNCV_289771 [Trichonephila clavipes]
MTACKLRPTENTRSLHLCESRTEKELTTNFVVIHYGSGSLVLKPFNEVRTAKLICAVLLEQRQARFGPFDDDYALLDYRFDELPNQVENTS